MGLNRGVLWVQRARPPRPSFQRLLDPVMAQEQAILEQIRRHPERPSESSSNCRRIKKETRGAFRATGFSLFDAQNYFAGGAGAGAAGAGAGARPAPGGGIAGRLGGPPGPPGPPGRPIIMLPRMASLMLSTRSIGTMNSEDITLSFITVNPPREPVTVGGAAAGSPAGPPTTGRNAPMIGPGQMAR